MLYVQFVWCKHSIIFWPWSYGSWIYNYLCNQFPSPLMLWVRISIRARCTILCDKAVVCQWLATCRWVSPGPPVSSNNKTDRHDITEILLKVIVVRHHQTNKQTNTINHIISQWQQISSLLNNAKLQDNWKRSYTFKLTKIISRIPYNVLTLYKLKLLDIQTFLYKITFQEKAKYSALQINMLQRIDKLILVKPRRCSFLKWFPVSYK